jgi:hypothetical protein
VNRVSNGKTSEFLLISDSHTLRFVNCLSNVMNMAGRSDKGSKNVDEHSVEVSNPVVFCVISVKKARTCV